MMSQTLSGQGNNPPDDVDCENLVAELAPKYNLSSMTHEEAQREISALTALEIADIHADVSGVPGLSTTLQEALQLTTLPSLPNPSGNNDTACTSVSPSPSQADLLQQFDTKMRQLPIEKNSAYKFACELNPNLVNARRKKMFLVYFHADYDIDAATERMAQYWEARVELFGPQRAFEEDLGMTEQEVQKIADRAVYRTLPYTDTAGRPVICIYPGRRKFSEYSADDELRGFWYLLESLMDNDQMREQGVVFIVDGRHIPFEWMFSTRGSQITTLMIKSLPLKVKGIHLCYANRVAGAFMSTMKWVYSKEMRLRFRIHCGDEGTVLNSLEQHSLPPRLLPYDVGGDIPLNELSLFTIGGSVPSTLQDGSLSASSPTTHRRTSATTSHESTSDIESQSVASQSLETKLKVMDRLFTSVEASCSVLPQQFHLTAEEEAFFINPKEKGGRKSDGRMNKAIVLSIRYPKIDRFDILLASGFVFPSDGEEDKPGKRRNEKNLVDAEGISLPQRKNQLRRRIKKLRESYDEIRSASGPAAPTETSKRGLKRGSAASSKRSNQGKKNTKRRKSKLHRNGNEVFDA